MRYVILCLTLCVPFIVFGQKNPPDWMTNKPHGISGTYIYEIGSGYDNASDTAQRKAFNSMIQKLSMMEGETYEVESTSKTDVVNDRVNDNIDFKEKFVFSGVVRSKGKKITKYIQEIDFYRNGNEYNALYRISEMKSDLRNPVYVYNETNKGLSFIPGAAQFNKHENTKGTMILIGEAGLITGIVVTQMLFSNFDSDYARYAKTGDMNNANISKSNRDNMFLVRNVCIIGATGLYIYNIIDGFLTNGKPQYAYNKTFKLYPSVTSSNNVALALSIKLF